MQGERTVLTSQYSVTNRKCVMPSLSSYMNHSNPFKMLGWSNMIRNSASWIFLPFCSASSFSEILIFLITLLKRKMDVQDNKVYIQTCDRKCIKRHSFLTGHFSMYLEHESKHRMSHASRTLELDICFW